MHGESAGKFESSNLSRDNVSREIGRTKHGCPNSESNIDGRHAVIEVTSRSEE